MHPQVSSCHSNNYADRADNHLAFVKSTMFKGKIHGRSEVEIRQYFKQWKADVEEKGSFDPEYYAEARRIGGSVP